MEPILYIHLTNESYGDRKWVENDFGDKEYHTAVESLYYKGDEEGGLPQNYRGTLLVFPDNTTQFEYWDSEVEELHREILIECESARQIQSDYYASVL
jgi:hypothetical protein